MIIKNEIPILEFDTEKRRAVPWWRWSALPLPPAQK